MKKRGRPVNKFTPPDWFNLSRYEAAEKLDMVGWFVQLNARSEVWGSNSSDLVSCFLDEVASNPILPRDRNFFQLEYCASPRNGQFGTTAVRPINYSDLQNLKTAFDPSPVPIPAFLRTRFQLFEPPFPPSPTNRALPVAEMTHEERLAAQPVHFANSGGQWRGYICLDLNCSDEVLCQQFATLLAEFRSQLTNIQGTLCPPDPSDAVQWITYGILPYIDLKLWADLNQLKPTYSNYSDHIFPPGTGGGEVVRKTTFPLVEKLMSSNFQQKWYNQLMLFL